MSHFLKHLFLLTLLTRPIHPKDLGIWGTTAPIAEVDLLALLRKKIALFSEEDRAQLILEIQQKIRSSLKTLEVKGIAKATRYSLSSIDPTMQLDRDIFNHEGKLLAKKGLTYNPLTQFSLRTLLFFDGTDEEQLNWAKKEPPSIWILVKGDPFQLEEEYNHPFYFDQGGVLTKKWKIQTVPTRISQENLTIKIESFPTGGPCPGSS